MRIELVTPLPNEWEPAPRRSGSFGVYNSGIKERQVFYVDLYGTHQSTVNVDRDSLVRMRDHLNKVLEENPE